MLAAGIVQDTLAGKVGEGEGGEVETTGGYFYHWAGNSSRFVAIEFLSKIANARTRIRNVRTYVYIFESERSEHTVVLSLRFYYIYILEKWFPLRGELQLLFRPC